MPNSSLVHQLDSLGRCRGGTACLSGNIRAPQRNAMTLRRQLSIELAENTRMPLLYHPGIPLQYTLRQAVSLPIIGNGMPTTQLMLNFSTAGLSLRSSSAMSTCFGSVAFMPWVNRRNVIHHFKAAVLNHYGNYCHGEPFISEAFDSRGLSSAASHWLSRCRTKEAGH